MRLRFLASEKRRPDQFTVSKYSYAFYSRFYLVFRLLPFNLHKSFFLKLRAKISYLLSGPCKKYSSRSWWISQWACRAFLFRKSSWALPHTSGTQFDLFFPYFYIWCSWYVLYLLVITGLQVVYDAKRLYKLVKEMNKWKNWLTYYETSFKRNPEKRPRTKVYFPWFSVNLKSLLERKK